ncbi:hypothetical protein [Actinoplanes sp. NPDC026619]|uniref:hypothetical protein n=1 Tax=Actinoplanes sp. NPDC026619 TaxID=3155798 RepID=UPI0033DAF1E2
MTPDVQLVLDLVTKIPGFEEIYEIHVGENDEVLPHVIFWDITQEVVASFLRNDPEPSKWSAALHFLEEGFE